MPRDDTRTRIAELDREIEQLLPQTYTNPQLLASSPQFNQVVAEYHRDQIRDKQRSRDELRRMA